MVVGSLEGCCILLRLVWVNCTATAACLHLQELYGETFALELLLQQTFLAVPEREARAAMVAAVRCTYAPARGLDV
jgi:hypothetical protein